MRIKQVRLAVSALTLSAAGLIGIAVNEGYRGGAYIPTRGDVPTIGFGSTRDVRMGDNTNPVEALKRLGHEVDETYESALRRCVDAPINQAEYDVYVDMAYNIGPAGFCRSTIVKRLNKRDYLGACDAILMWRIKKLEDGTRFDCSTLEKRIRKDGTLEEVPNLICYGMWKRRLEAHEKCLSAQEGSDVG